MKNARTFTLVPALSDPPPRGGRATGSLGRALGSRMFWQLLALAVGMALAQLAVRPARSAAPAGRSAGAIVAAGAAAGGPPAAGATNGPFRDEDSCELVGEPVECR